MAFSAFLTIANDTSKQLNDIQIVLDNNHDQVQLFEFGSISKNSSSSIRYGIIVHPSSSDNWTVTYTDNDNVYRVNRYDFGVKSSDAGRNILISFKDNNKVSFKRKNKTVDTTATKP